jgi:hypothetical protein
VKFTNLGSEHGGKTLRTIWRRSSSLPKFVRGPCRGLTSLLIIHHILLTLFLEVVSLYTTRDKEPLYTGFGSFTFQQGLPVQIDTNQQQSGFVFKNEDNEKIFQATLSGFAFNRLAPYKSWEEFSSDAKYLWDIYKDICKPISVMRAAIRFINQLKIPLKDQVDIQDYLRTVPEISPDLPQKTLNSFFMQLQVPQGDLNCMLVINEALAPITEQYQLLMILMNLIILRTLKYIVVIVAM